MNWPTGKEIEKEDGSFEYVKINVEDNKDFHEVPGGILNLKSQRIDVFYGDKRMFIAVHCSPEKRKEIHEIIKKKFIMPEPKNFTGEEVKINRKVKNEKKN